MKKRWLSLLMLFCFSLCFIGGCKDTEESVVDKLNINGSDVVLKVGEDKIYTADELFADMLNSGIGAEAAYAKILKMVVESTIPVDANMTASWELLLKSFEEEVESTAATDGTSEDEARTKLLTEQGYSSIEEKKEAYLYDVRLSKLQDKYWDVARDGYYESYLEDRLPYYVKHALVKTSYTSATGPYATTIESSDATALYNIYKWLVDGHDFSDIMHEYSEDTGSQETAIGYHMDITTSFVTEFLHGVISFDALLKGKTSEVVGITNSANFYKGSAANSYNFGVINASDIVVLGENASNGDTKSITTYENVLNSETQVTEEKNVGTISNAYGSYSLYNRSIVFNQTFNNPGISVINYDLGDDKAQNTYELNINGVKQKVLTDENGNIVFVVCARGSSNDLWIHFLTVSVSAFDENIKLFYSMDQDATIAEMVEEKRVELSESGKTEAEITNELNTYKAELEKYQTYVDLKVKNDDTLANRNKVIDELEGYIKTYAKRGITSGTVSGKDQFLTYDMVEYYMNEGNIEIVNANVKTLIENYINAQKELIDFSAINSIVEGWNDYYDLITLANSDEIVSKKIPMECSYVVNGNSSRGTLCKYNYETGFEILMRYMDGNTEMTVADEYKSYHIGDASFTLPEPTKSGFTFEGWYTTSDFSKEATIDTMRSSTNNKTELYAKWTQN